MTRSTDVTGDTTAFPGFDNLYLLHSSGAQSRFCYADLDEGTPDYELLRGERSPARPLEAVWAMGRATPGEIALGRSIGWYYLSPNTQQLLRDHGVTGWTTYPMNLYRKDGALCPGYAGLSVIGRCGPVQEDRSVRVPDQNRRPGTPDLVGIYFDESTWDGSDLFCPAGTNALLFATAKVKDLFESCKLSGFRFTPLNEAMWYP